MGAELEIVKKRGAFYSYQDLKLGQGRDKSIEFLEANPELCEEIENQIRQFAKDSDTPILQFAAGDDDDDEGAKSVDDSDDGYDLDDDEDDDDL